MYKEITISKTLLKHQYETMRVTEIMGYYGICCARLYRILDDCGIERKRDNLYRSETKKVVYSD